MLRVCLQSFLDSNAKDIPYELVVVANACNDDTVLVVKEFESRLPLKFVQDPVLGLCQARNTGWQNANGCWVGYIDDDAKLSNDYIPKAIELLKELNPDLIGGPYLPFYTEPKCRWFKDEYCSFKGQEGRVTLPSDVFLSGTNMIYRRSILADSGGFNIQTGFVGNKRIYGDETELQLRLRQEFPDFSIIWDSSLVVYHYCPIWKQKLKMAMRDAIIRGRSQHHMRKLLGTLPSRFNSVVKGLTHTGILTYKLTIGWLFRNRRKFHWWQQYYYESIIKNLEGSVFHFSNIFDTTQNEITAK